MLIIHHTKQDREAVISCSVKISSLSDLRGQEVAMEVSIEMSQYDKKYLYNDAISAYQGLAYNYSI